MNRERLLANLTIAIEAVFANRMRSILTALGIIFGVAAVIAMLAIGNGAQQEIIEQIKLVGVNNIIVKPIVEQTEEDLAEEDGQKESKKFSPGLTLNDKKSIMETIPGITSISPEILLETYIIKNGVRRSAKLVGVEPSYFDIFNFTLKEGKMFNAIQLEKGEAVCIIGKSIEAKFFPSENPIGKMIKCGSNWLKVIGVLDERYISETSISKLGIRDYNMDVYTPLQTVLSRYKNRALLTEEMIQASNRGSGGRFMFFGGSGSGSEEESSQSVNYHQLDRMVIQVSETERLNTTAEVVVRMLERKHREVIDYEIEIPELLLKQQQRTNDIFSYVLGAIAGISLIVGGIGIMNIMLASVLERIKEIGLRLSIGAKKSDIVNQFMFESMMISVSGGFIGIILGIIMAFAVSNFANIPTIISFSSVLISFGVATAIGLIFGIAPARKAALQDPITSLRYE
ncbi:MAG: ABC transporter permease [Ekhidna sp.]